MILSLQKEETRIGELRAHFFCLVWIHACILSKTYEVLLFLYPKGVISNFQSSASSPFQNFSFKIIFLLHMGVMLAENTLWSNKDFIFINIATFSNLLLLLLFK